MVGWRERAEKNKQFGRVTTGRSCLSSPSVPFQDVGTQAVVTEYLVRYVDLIFNDKIPTFSHSTNGVEGTPKKCRPKSLAISTPTKLISIEEARTRALTTAIKPDQKYIEVGECEVGWEIF